MSTKIRIKKERTALIIKKTSFFSKRYRLFFSKKKIYSKKGYLKRLVLMLELLGDG